MVLAAPGSRRGGGPPGAGQGYRLTRNRETARSTCSACADGSRFLRAVCSPGRRGRGAPAESRACAIAQVPNARGRTGGGDGCAQHSPARPAVPLWRTTPALAWCQPQYRRSGGLWGGPSFSCAPCRSGWYSAALCARPEGAGAVLFTLYTAQTDKRKRVGEKIPGNW